MTPTANNEKPITHLDIALALEAKRMAKAVTDVIYSEFKLTGYASLKQCFISTPYSGDRALSTTSLKNTYIDTVQDKVNQLWETLANPMRLSVQVGGATPPLVVDGVFGVSFSIWFSIENHDSDQQYLHVEIKFTHKGNALEIDTRERYLNPEVAIHLAR